jgi:hypothetical protein
MAYKRALLWKQKEASRAVRAAQAAGLTVERLEISPDGKISVVTGHGKPEPAATPFDAWKDNRNARPA